MCLDIFPACVCAPHVCSGKGRQKSALDPLEFQADVRGHVGAGKESGSSERSAGTLNWANSLAPRIRSLRCLPVYSWKVLPQ